MASPGYHLIKQRKFKGLYAGFPKLEVFLEGPHSKDYIALLGILYWGPPI